MNEQAREEHEEKANGGAEGGVAAPDQQEPEAIEVLIDALDPAELARHVQEQEAADAADTLERLEPAESLEVLQRMSADTAAEALAQMVPELAATVLMDLDLREAADLVGRLAPDDAADLIQELPEERASEIVARLHPKRAAEILKLGAFDPESAGGMMTTDILVVRANRTIGQAIETIRRFKIDEIQHDVYCVDDNRCLVGIISLRELLVNDDNDLVAQHMQKETHAVAPEMDREDVARLFERYDLVTIPVIDDRQRVLGMVTIDDVFDILAEEVTEDALKQVGAGADEAVYSSLATKLKGRLPWLAINLPLAGIGAVVIYFFEGLISELAIIAVLYPIIANQAGNTGHQSMAVTLRGLVLGDIKKERVAPLLARELAFGIITGLVIGSIFTLLLLGLGAMGGTSFSAPLSAVAGASMALALSVGCLVGTSMPLLMERMGFDPATASSILVTMLTDALSYFTFLGLVFLFKAWLL